MHSFWGYNTVSFKDGWIGGASSRTNHENRDNQPFKWHQYEDKIIDQPFLTPDSVKE